MGLKCYILSEKQKIEDNCISSTKKVKENHGFGLLNIKEAVAKYDGDVILKVNENEEGYEFSIEIILWF